MGRKFSIASLAFSSLALANCSGSHTAELCSSEDENCVIAEASQVRVIDADTVEHENVRYRLFRWDGPELGQYAQCPEENTKGRQARFAVQEILRQGSSVVFNVLDETPTGVKLADVFVDEADLGSRLQGQGFTVEWNHEGRGAKPSWCQSGD